MKKLGLLFAMLCVCAATVFAQEGFRIVTNHPDFKIKVVRCEVSGKTCVIDLILENASSRDVRLNMSGNYYKVVSVAYDDEANEYVNFRVGIGSSGLDDAGVNTTLLSEVPVKARIQIEGVVPSATMFRRMDVTFYCEEWGLNENKKVKFYNLPITHDGD